jgi:cytochrome c oxidase subunit II
MRQKFVAGLAGLGISLGVTGMAFAQSSLEVIGQPIDKLTGFQPAVTDKARDLQSLDHMLNIIMGVIVVFVTALLIYCIVRYNRRTNPTPSTFTHNTPIEIAWTIVPIAILVFIGAFSLPVLFHDQEIPVADITIKATGNQWYWGYEYVDEGVAFDSFLVDASYKIDDPAAGWGPDQEIGTQQVLNDLAVKKLEYFGYSRDQFLLATDTAVVVPVNKTIVVQLTGADVIHAWAVPAFGLMQSAVPGRLSQTWFKAEKEGIYFGQCTALCGQSHAYMPITVKVVSQPVYDAWLAAAKGGNVLLSDATPGVAPVAVAQND